jgi:hypothetical protein
MARTRGLALKSPGDNSVYATGSDGSQRSVVVLPARISTLHPHATPDQVRSGVQHMDDGVLDPPPAEVDPAPAAPPPGVVYQADRKTFGRNMTGFEAMELLAVFLGREVSLTLDREAFMKLSPDGRRHFRRMSAPL